MNLFVHKIDHITIFCINSMEYKPCFCNYPSQDFPRPLSHSDIASTFLSPFYQIEEVLEDDRGYDVETDERPHVHGKRYIIQDIYGNDFFWPIKDFLSKYDYFCEKICSIHLEFLSSNNRFDLMNCFPLPTGDVFSFKENMKLIENNLAKLLEEYGNKNKECDIKIHIIVTDQYEYHKENSIFY